MKTILTSFVILSVACMQAQTIQQARSLSIGATVTVKGVVSNGSELGSIRYIQDATAGIACYGNNLSGIALGDSITATGVLFDFSGLLELSPTNSFTNHGPVTQNVPQVIPITSAGELLESQLVRIENVTFVQTGSFAAGNSTVQITSGGNTLDVRINGTTNIDGTSIPAGAVTITGLLGQFNANYQIVPRSLADIVPYVAPAREINVKINGNTVLDNGTYVIGNTAANTITVENSGVQNLTVSGTTLTGTQAADFTTNLNTATIGATSSQNFNLNFAPTGNGTRVATLTIANDDNDENPYIIHLLAVGLDNLATEPTSNPSNLTFTNLQAYTFTGNYTAGTGAEKYVVLWSKTGPVSGVPVDGTTYLRGDVLGNAKVAYTGSGTSFVPRGVRANQPYYLAVYAFNGPAGFENYRTVNPATGNVTTTGLNIGNYYAGINAQSPTFLSNLSSLINPHTQISYFNYKQTLINQFETCDTTAGQSYVTCVYSGERKVFTDPFDWTVAGYSREHSYCHSWMPSYPCDNPELPEYTDLHNLYPTNLANANSPRSNLPLLDITGSIIFTYLEGNVGYHGNQMCYEPRAAQKGNSARSIFYEATCYNGQNGLNWSLPAYQDQNSLKNWHFNDLPDAYEIARQEYIYNVQGNRNPFIDSINYVCHIDFSNMHYLGENCYAGVAEQLAANFSVFPVPSNNKVYAQVNNTTIVGYTIFDMSGRRVKQDNNLEVPVLILDASSLNTGQYILAVETPFGTTQRSFVIE
ncbi:MAG: choice-of-anchor D domain-containing protein [Flavobacteriia bacterium]|nr:choice-of-anchor D domain-containing protein [Flavobacteriia bacterium]